MRQKAETIDFHSGLGDSANLLYGLTRSMKPEICVEIGSALGKSASYIGLALRENGRGKLYAIDPHMTTNWNDEHAVDSYDIFRTNIASLGLDDQITMLRATSEEAARNWKAPIDLIFIDGDHSYEGVKRDWELFLPFINPFGIVIFHDTIWELRPDPRYARDDMGVPRFVDELRAAGYQVVTIDRDCGVSLVQPTLGGQTLHGQ
jgi:predicted O-methyltransferase YrrM